MLVIRGGLVKCSSTPSNLTPEKLIELFISLSWGVISVPELLVTFSEVPSDVREKFVGPGPKGTCKMLS